MRRIFALVIGQRHQQIAHARSKARRGSGPWPVSAVEVTVAGNCLRKVCAAS